MQEPPEVRKTLDPLELEIQMIVNYHVVLRTGPRSSSGAVSALKLSQLSNSSFL